MLKVFLLPTVFKRDLQLVLEFSGVCLTALSSNKNQWN